MVYSYKANYHPPEYAIKLKSKMNLNKLLRTAGNQAEKKPGGLY